MLSSWVQHRLHCYLQKGIRIQGSGIEHSRSDNSHCRNMFSVSWAMSLSMELFYWIPFHRTEERHLLMEWLRFYRNVLNELCILFFFFVLPVLKSCCSFPLLMYVVCWGIPGNCRQICAALAWARLPSSAKKRSTIPALLRWVCLGWLLVAHC